MKRKTNRMLSIATMAVALAALVFSCKKDNDPNVQSIVIEREYFDCASTTVTVTGVYSYAGQIDGIKIQVGCRNDFTDAHAYDCDLDGTNFFVEVTGLQPGTDYRYRYEVDYGFSKPFLTEAKSFTTLSESPEVKALEWLKIDSTTYRIKCQVVADGGSEITERGICWNTFGDPMPYDDNDSTRKYEGSVGVFEEYLVRMEHMELGKKYYVRAFAKNAAGKMGRSDEEIRFEISAPVGSSVNIEVGCNPDEGGTASEGGTFEVGTLCTVTAMANPGFRFVNWTENGLQVSSNAEYPFMVSVGRSLVANFTRQAYDITAVVEPEDSGTVAGAGGYDYDQECTLTATANTGYEFMKWTKGGTTVSTDASYTFPVTETATYKAHFKIKSYSIDVSANPTNGGTVEGGGTYNHNQSCTVKATPAEGFAFTNWTDDDDVVSEDAEYTFAVTGGRNLVANFKELQADEYSIQVSANPTEGGTATGGGTYQQGVQCTVNATPKPGFTFINWTENGNQVHDSLEYTFTVAGNRILVANFEAEAPTEYTINVSANPTEGGRVTGEGTYQQGNQCTVEATANEGYTFINWTTENGELTSANARYTFIVNSDRNLVANFQVQSYTISVSADPTNGGSVDGGGTFNHGESCTVHAQAAVNYHFTNWTEDGNVVSTDTSYTFSVNANRTLIANFTYNSIGGHEYVDLGLPSGLLWATCNVGANNPEDYGDYFAWGEITTKDTYNWSTYRYCKGSNTTMTKYCDNSNYGYNGFTDNQTTLQPEDDAATANWGSGWRMPTRAEWQELLVNTTDTWTTRNGVYGRIFTATNGNCLFLPAAGYRSVTNLNGAGSDGLYWSSALYTNPHCAWDLYFGTGNCDMYYGNRYGGLSVRAVRSASQN